MAKKLELQSKNYTQIEVVAGADIVNGELQTEGVLNGFPLIDVLSGEPYAMITKAEKVVCEKVALGAIAAGAAAYWVNATKNVAGAGDIFIGYVYEDAADGAILVTIEFDGAAAFEKL